MYLQTWKSDVFALDRRTGRVRWARNTTAPNDGPNGVAVVGRTCLRGDGHDRVRARRRARGAPLERGASRRKTEQFVDIAPGRRPRARLPQHRRLPAGRPRAPSTRSTPRTGTIASGGSTRSRDPWPHPRRGSAAAPGTRLRRRRRAASTRALEPRAVGRHADAARTAAGLPRPARSTPTRSSCSTGATGRLALVRPGDAARRPRLRLPRLAGPRARSVASSGALVVRRRQGGPGRRLGPGARASGVWAQRRSARTCNDLGPLPRDAVRVCPGLFGGVLTPDGLRGRTALRPRRRALHARERGHVGVRVAPAAADAQGEGRALRARRRDGRQLLAAPAAARRSSAARPSRATSSSRRRSTGGCTRSRRTTARRLWQARAPAGINALPGGRRRPARSCGGRRAASREPLAEPVAVADRATPRADASVTLRAEDGRLSGRRRARGASERVERAAETARAAARERRDGRVRQDRADQARARRARVPRPRALRGRARDREDGARARDRRLDRGRDRVARSSARRTCSRPTSPGSPSSTSRRASSSSAPARCSRTSCSSTRSTARCRRRSRRCSRRWPSAR